MTKINLICLTLLSALSLSVTGCSGLAEQPKPQNISDTQDKRPTTLLDRYELREIRNGTYYGTALLDKQTGRIWTLGTESKGEEVGRADFEEVAVYPRPEGAATQAGAGASKIPTFAEWEKAQGRRPPLSSFERPRSPEKEGTK
jgi:hypothetical protein